MANKPNNAPEAEVQQDVLFSEETRKNIIRISAGVLGLAAIILIYIFAVRNPSINSANNAIAEVDIQAMNQEADSVLMQNYAEVAANHGGDAGNRAAYMAAVLNFQSGNYEEALALIQEYDGSDVLIAALACGIKGDCLVNLDRYDEALKAFSEAIDVAGENERLMPYFLTKKATVLSAMGNHKEAAEIYEKITKDYPTQMPQNTNARMLQEKGLASSAE